MARLFIVHFRGIVQLKKRRMGLDYMKIKERVLAFRLRNSLYVNKR